MYSVSNDPEHPDVIANKPRLGGKVLKIGFNGIAAIFQLILIVILAACVITNFMPKSSVAFTELHLVLGMAGATAAVLLIIGLPFITLSALLGVRKRCGAGRPADQPPKLLTWDSFLLLICAFLLFTPVVLFFAAAYIAG